MKFENYSIFFFLNENFKFLLEPLHIEVLL